MYERPIPRGWWELFPTGYPWANGSALCRLEGKKKRRDGQNIAYYESRLLNKTNVGLEKGMLSGKSEINDKQNENAAHCLQDLGNQVLHAPFQIQLPYSKVHGANMGLTWVLSAPDGPHVGPMNLAIREYIPRNMLAVLLCFVLLWLYHPFCGFTWCIYP